VLPRKNLADPFIRFSSNPRFFNSLPPLKIPCPSFSDRRPLFSIACGLFLQKGGGGIPFWTFSADSPFTAQLPLESTLAKVIVN
jgi:hypothetical protein